MSVDIKRLRTTVQAGSETNSEILAVGMSDIHSHVVESDASELPIDVPITLRALDYATEHCMDENYVMLFFRMEAVVEVQHSVDTEWTEMTAHLEDPSVDLTPSIHVARSTWFDSVLAEARMVEYVFLEIPVPESPDKDRWLKARQHLEQAEHMYRHGNDAQVLAACYAALESLHPDPKQVFASMADREKRKHVDELMIGTKRYLHSGRHVVRDAEQTDMLGDFDVDHRDASFALALTKCWIAYATQLLQSN
jgi:hypothetical protein